MTIKRFIKKLLSKNSWLKMYHYSKHTINGFNQDNAVIVWSEGHTRTHLLCRTIHQKYAKTHDELMGVHRVGKNGVVFSLRSHASYNLQPMNFWTKITTLYLILLVPNMKRTNRRFRLVTGIREPLARLWSRFIHYNRDFIKEQPIEVIHAKFKQMCNDYKDYSASWFEKTYLPDTGINVYDYAFDKEKGYGFVGNGKVRGMIIKSEAACKEGISPQNSDNTDTILKALSEFTDMPIPRWWLKPEDDSFETIQYYKRYKDVNDSFFKKHESLEDSEFYKRYNEVVDSFIADDDYLDYVYNSKYVKHFYTEKEIAAFRTKWKHKDFE